MEENKRGTSLGTRGKIFAAIRYGFNTLIMVQVSKCLVTRNIRTALVKLRLKNHVTDKMCIFWRYALAL